MAPSIDVMSLTTSANHARLDSPYFPAISRPQDAVTASNKRWPLLTGPLTWTGGDLAHEHEYVYNLSKDETEEITSALRHFQGLGLNVADVNPETFPLPGLQSKLAQIGQDLFDGRGFTVIRGIDSQSFGVEENVIISLGVTSYIQKERTSQNSRGQMIRHIIDADWTGVPIKDRPSGYSNHAQYFHTDFACEVLVLYAVNTAAEGGYSNLASGWRVYNELAQTRPDVLDLLAKGNWATEDDGNPEVPYINRTVLHVADGKPMFNIERRTLMGAAYAPRPENIPAMTKAQVEALDLVQSLSEKHQISTPIRPGDIRLVNNYAVLHSREKFQDDGTTKRHLIRLWLKGDDGEVGWKLPDELVRIIDSRASGRKVDADWTPGLSVEAQEVYAQARETCDGGSARFDD